jgi:hypothetical protein
METDFLMRQQVGFVDPDAMLSAAEAEMEEIASEELFNNPKQFGTPGQSSRDDAIEAIKRDLTKPKRMGASPNADDSFSRER